MKSILYDKQALARSILLRVNLNRVAFEIQVRSSLYVNVEFTIRA